MDKAQPGVGNLTKVLFVASTFVFWCSLYVYVPILPTYTQQLGGSLAMVGLVVGAYGVTQFVLRVPLGVFSDRLGRRKPFILFGTLTAAAGAAGFLVAGDPWGLFLARALTGVAASSWVAFTVLFSSYFPPGKAVRAMSLVTFVSGSSQLVATFAGGQIAQRFGSVSTFWVGLALAGVAALASLAVRDEPRRTTAPPSWEQVARVMTGSPRQYQSTAAGAVSPRQYQSAVAGAVPLLLIVSFNAVLSQYAAYVTTYAFTPIYAAGLGASRADLGLLVTAMLISSTIGQLLAGNLVERWGERVVVAGGMLIAATGIAATPFVATVPLLLGLQALNGLGRGLGFPVLMGLSVRYLPQQQRATAMGVFQATYALGMFAGPFAGGQIADAFGLDMVFYSTGVVCLASAGLALLIPGRRATRARNED
ncbi:MAG: MFS transporter [Chloroflexi bacterium]|nr:MFS transporter [Chloroflexota bacterium]